MELTDDKMLILYFRKQRRQKFCDFSVVKFVVLYLVTNLIASFYKHVSKQHVQVSESYFYALDLSLWAQFFHTW